jgi:hypothetical protein
VACPFAGLKPGGWHLLTEGKMPVAEIGKIYTYNGKKYVARKAQKPQDCAGCDLYAIYAPRHMACPKLMHDGLPHTCIDEKARNDVIFVEVERS